MGLRLTPRRIVAGLIAFQVLDALVNVVPNEWMRKDLEHLRVPNEARFVFASVKAASAAGLLAGIRRPAVGKLTARALIAYFVLAVGAHIRIKDRPVRYLPAVSMLGWAVIAARSFAHDQTDPEEKQTPQRTR